MEKNVVVLAAGKGTRMKSRDPNHSKVSYPILGKALVNYVLDACEPLNFERKVVIVGFGGEVTKSLVEKQADVVWQREIKGTGHAVMQTAGILRGKKGSTLVVCGDTPLITTETIANVFDLHERHHNDLTIASMVLENPTGYGRIIRETKSNKVIAIKEHKDCTDEEKEITEVNSGMYIFNNELLFKYIDKITPNNAQGEYYLTDVIEMFVKDNLNVGAYVVTDAVEMFGINDRSQLAYAAKVMRKRINNKLMLSGVSIEDPDTTYIGPDVEIGKDTIILPNTYMLGKTTIGEANIIGPNVYLENAQIGNDNRIKFANIKDARINDKEDVGPFANIVNK